MAATPAVTDSAGLLANAQANMQETLGLQVEMNAMAIENNAQQTAEKMSFDAQNDGIKLINGATEAVTSLTGTIVQQMAS